MRAKHKINEQTIRITEDLSPEDRETRKQLAPYSLEEKNKGNKVFMRRDTLVVNGKAWSLHELQNRDAITMDTGTNSQIPPRKDISEEKSLKRTINEIVSPTKHTSFTKKPKGDKITKTANLSNQKSLIDLWNSSPNSNPPLNSPAPKSNTPLNSQAPINNIPQDPPSTTGT